MPSDPRSQNPRVVEKHPLWLRIVHWINFPVTLLMIWSGVLIYWANDVYPGFFPKCFYQAFHLHHRLAEGMAVHFTLGWIFVINGALYVAFLFTKGHWRELFPDRRTPALLGPTIRHDLGLSDERPPQGKFNAAQRLAYSGILLIGVLEALSGFAIYKPVQLRPLTWLFGGYEGARLFHFVGMLSLSGFFVLHVLQVARAGWNNFRAMVAGFELEGDR